MKASAADRFGFRKERKDLLRALAGGAIVGMPLLYTMEVWFHGATLSSWHQLTVLVAMLVVNFFFCLVSGFRHEGTVGAAAMQAITSVGIALVFSATVLWLIGIIDPFSSVGEAIGKILLEASAVSLGVSFADAHFHNKSRLGDEEAIEDNRKVSQPSPEDLEKMQLDADLVDVSATLVGSILFALNIAPTEEVLLIAAQLDAWKLLALLIATVFLCYVILYASEFESQPVFVKSVFQSAWAETAMTVAISLLAGLGLLLIMGEREITSHISSLVAATVVLGFPATAGGAAGRLIT